MKVISSKAVLVMVLALICLPVISGCGKDDEKSAAPAETVKKVPVVTTKCRQMNFTDAVSVSANVLAIDSAKVAARVTGTLDAIYVDEGDIVQAGKTQLFQSDRVALANAVDAASQQVNVASAAVNAAKATVDRISTDLDKATVDAERFQRLYDANKAISKIALEDQQSRQKQLAAALQEASAGVTLAQAQHSQTKSSLEVARKNLSDSLVVAPISGIVTSRYAEPGEMAEGGQTVLEIVDLSKMEISAYLPEQYYSRVVVGETAMRLTDAAAAGKSFTVTYKSAVVDKRLRTFEVKAVIDPVIDQIVPGMLVHANVVFSRHDALGVPLDAVISRGGEKVIFVSDGTTARQVAVKQGLRTNGFVEVTGDGLDDSTVVITQGQSFCNDGDQINIVGEDE